MNREILFTAPICFILSLGMIGCSKHPEPDDSPTPIPKRIVEQIGDRADVKIPVIDKPIIEGKFTPPDGKLILFIGQDSETLTEYFQNTPEDKIEGITLYTRIIGDSIGSEYTDSLPGLYGPSDWGAGIVDYKRSLAEAPGANLAVGLFISDTDDGENRCQSKHTKAIAAGELDDVVEDMLHYYKDLAPRKVFLRIGYEFDGPWNCYRPEPYKAAYRHIAKKIKELKAENVVTVWQSAVWPAHDQNDPQQAVYDHRRDDMLDMWYPGDDVVDWMGISVFYRDLTQWNYVPVYTPAAAQEKFIAFARKHSKPVLIAESAPQGYSIGELTHSFTQENTPIKITAEQLWDAWFGPFLGFVYNNRDVIRGVAYINAQWESQRMWRCDKGHSIHNGNCNTGNWGDSRVHANPIIKERWLNHITNAKIWEQDPAY